MDIAQYLAKLEVSKPALPGMYLRLIHGRTSLDEQLKDWGPNGPVLGPLKWCHITYMSTINLCAMDDEEGTGPMCPSGSDPMYFTHDLLFYKGMYYGDWELEAHS